MLHRLIPAIVVMVGLSALGAAWRSFWASAAGLRTRGALQRLERRVFGAPRPQPVEIGPDGQWRPYVHPKAKRAEKRAGFVIFAIVAVMTCGGLFAAFAGH